MAERSFDEPGRAEHGAQDVGRGFGPFAGASGAPPGGGPLGDWLTDGAPTQWPGPPGRGFAPYAPEPGLTSQPGPWVPAPVYEREPSRPRWSAAGVAPWAVAGLLCAYLLSGRGAAAPAPSPAPPVAPGTTDVGTAPAADTAALEPVAACPGVTP